MSTDKPLLPGLPVMLGGIEYAMPSLSVAASRRYWDRIQAMERGDEPDPLGLTVALVAACLKRNYPEITEDEVAEHVDMDNVDELGAKCFGRGSFRAWCERMAAASGNPVAPQPSEAAGTGAPSTQPSAPPPAGDSTTSAP